MNPNRKKVWYAVLLVASASAAALSLYLQVQHTRLMSGIQDSSSFCSLGSFANCDIVNSSRFSQLGGVPVAALGALYFFLVLVAGITAQPGGILYPLISRWVGWTSLSALVFEFYLVVVQAAYLKTGCIFCLTLDGLTVAILWAVVMLSPATGSVKNRLASVLWKASVGFPQGARLPKPALGLAGLSVTVFIAAIAFIPSFVRSRGNHYSRFDTAVDEYIDRWKNLPRKKMAALEGDGTLGTAGSKVNLTLYSDFECPHCRKAAFTLHTILPALEGRVLFRFKHFPLDSTCNPGMQSQMHPMVCLLAKLAYCAERKGKFWEFHDTVFLDTAEEEIRQGVDAFASKLKLFTREEITRCLQDSRALHYVRENIQSATELGIRGTPTFYINGKLVEIPLTIENIHRLVDLEEALVR